MRCVRLVGLLALLASSACGNSSSPTTTSTSVTTDVAASGIVTTTTVDAGPVVTATDSAGNVSSLSGNVIDRVEPDPCPVTSGTTTTASAGQGTEDEQRHVLVTRIIFSKVSPSGYVEVTNNGAGPANLTDLFLVRWTHPIAYRFALAEAALGVGERLWVSIGEGPSADLPGAPSVVLQWEGGPTVLTRESGNISLYAGEMAGNLRDDPAAILDYVQWGPAEYRPDGECFAVSAGVWEDSVVLDAQSVFAAALTRQGSDPGVWEVTP